MAIQYFRSGVDVHLGDRVQTKVWFRRRLGRVVYLPGVSRFNAEFERHGLRWVAIRTHGMIVSTIVDPRSETLKKRVIFLARDGSSFEEPPDDPQTYEQQGGGWSP